MRVEPDSRRRLASHAVPWCATKAAPVCANTVAALYPVTRRVAVSLLMITAARTPVEAAIPSISEYSSVQYRAKSTAPATSSPDVPISAIDGLHVVQSDLKRAASLAEAGELEDIRSLLRQQLFATFLGYNPGIRGGAQNLRPSAALIDASTSAEPLRELLLDLKRLDDFCIANRIMIFNQEDLDQVKSLMAAPAQKPESRFDLDEVRGFIDDAQEHAAEALAALR